MDTSWQEVYITVEYWGVAPAVSPGGLQVCLYVEVLSDGAPFFI